MVSESHAAALDEEYISTYFFWPLSKPGGLLAVLVSAVAQILILGPMMFFVRLQVLIRIHFALDDCLTYPK